MTSGLATIVVTQRERFSFTDGSLDRIFALTPAWVDLVYVGLRLVLSLRVLDPLDPWRPVSDSGH